MKKPVTFLGINGAEALKRKLEEKEEGYSKPTITPATIQNPNDYILLEGRQHGVSSFPNYSYPDICVAMDKSYHGKKWNECHEELSKDSSFMLSIRQYIDFINLLRSGKVYNAAGKQVEKQKLDSILDEILTARNPWRAEWLDARFLNKQKQQYITYGRFSQSGGIKEVTEELDGDTLMEDKQISLEDWLENPTRQGLPREDVKPGSLYYWHQRVNSVARFFADAVGAGLDCYGVPRGSDSALGVRRAKIRI
jgi:hypothetical protein